MVRRALLVLVLVAACTAPSDGSGAARGGGSPSRVAPDGAITTLLFAGDVMLGRGVAPIAEADPLGVFEDVRFEVGSTDMAVANLESPLTTRPHTSSNPNALEASPATASLLSGAGFDAMSLANNHAGDAGAASVVDTIDALRAAGLRSVGAGTDADAAFAPVILERNGLRVALLAFDATGEGLRAGDGPGVAWLDPSRVGEEVRAARASADLVVVGLHAGAEYYPGRDPFTTRLARSFARMGVDVVWVSGPHVIRPTLVVDPDGDGRPTVVATSLGNLLFDQAFPGTRRGALLEVRAGSGGVLAYRVGTTEDTDLRVHFRGWRPPTGDAVALDGQWWSPTRPIERASVRSAARSPQLPDGAVIIDEALGDATGDGSDDVVVSFRQPFRDTPEKQTMPGWPWTDAPGRSAHLGLYRSTDLRAIWVAGTLVRPISSVAVCDGALAVAYSDLDDPAVVATSAWLWRGFGFDTLDELPGPGVPACADVDGDGRLDPAIVERSSS
jgi:poly-gamma-glutamate synthesis protein (capsule biosynthesis protein)